MADIAKLKRTITITTMSGATFTVADTDECSPASLALAQFKRGGVMEFVADGDEYFVPTTAVDNIKVEYASDSE